MKFVKKIKFSAQAAKEHFNNLNEEQKLQSFALAWEGAQVPNLPLVNRVKAKLPGPRYRAILELLNKIVLGLETIEERDTLLKELNHFYSTPITEKHRAYYPDFKQRINVVLVAKPSEEDIVWLIEKIIPDIKECEYLQKNRLLKRYGLPFDEKVVLNNS